jgi:hypothetical protein
LFEFGVVATSSVDSFGDIFQYKVEVHFVFLGEILLSTTLKIGTNTHLVTIRIEKRFEVDNVGVRDESHDLQLTILNDVRAQ